jgi:uncharacterized protein (DUF58 family)
MNNGVTVDLAELIGLRFSVSKLHLFSPLKTSQQQSGTKTSSHLGRGMDFAKVRPYQAGDDVRHINWRLTARTGKPFSKVYQEERERPVYVLVDQSASMRFGTRNCFKSVLAARIAALITWASLQHNDQIGGTVFTDTQLQTIKPKRQRKTALQFLDAIVTVSQASTQAGTDNQLTRSLKNLQRNIHAGSIVVLITDGMQLNAENKILIQGLSQHNTVLCIMPFDPIERAAPKKNLFHFTDGEAQLEFDGYGKQAILAYQQLFTTRYDALVQLSQQCRLQLLPLATNANLIDELNKVRM